MWNPLSGVHPLESVRENMGSRAESIRSRMARHLGAIGISWRHSSAELAGGMLVVRMVFHSS
jgi:hypothetical protein